MCSGREDSLMLGCFLCNVVGDAMTDLKEGFSIQTFYKMSLVFLFISSILLYS